MIRKIILKNFQGHKSTIIDLHPGLNVCVGANHSGKTSLLRAMWWLHKNRPSGGAFIHHKASIARVLAAFGSRIVQRKKGEGVNQYVVNGVTFDNVNVAVPEEVARTMRLADINFQLQHDPPFLLALSPAETAKYVNKILQMEDITIILKMGDDNKRTVKRKLDTCTARIENIKEELQAFSWIQEAQARLLCLKELQKERAICEVTAKEQTTIMERVGTIQKEEQTIMILIEAAPLCASITVLQQERETARKAQVVQKEMCTQYDYYIECITELKENIEQLTARLPSTCPMCGGVLNNE